MRKPERRYRAALAIIPAPGTGGGSHRAIYRAACCGIEAGRSDEEIFSDIRAAIPPCTKPIPDSAIHETIRNAHTRTKTAPDRAKAGNPPVYRPIPPPRRTEAQMIADALNTPAGAEATQEGITTREGE